MKTTNLKTYMLIAILAFYGCIQDNHFRENKGPVFGTYYSVVYDSNEDYGTSFDSIFNEINNAISSYRINSEISRFNSSGYIQKPFPIFFQQLQSAKYYHKITNGAFEPTLMPLIEAWGFGLEKRKTVNSTQIDSLLKLVSFSKNIFFSKDIVKSERNGTKLDLSALGEGYTLNCIANFLDNKNIQNYKVEIGGELKCKGTNTKGAIWKIGIANPYYDLGTSSEQMMGMLELKNTSLSTSGSYRKFYVDDLGKKRAHIIDPKTGYPVSHGLLSVSIKCKDAEKADALATACMVMGTIRAKEFIEKNKDIEGYLIYENDHKKIDTWSSNGFFDEGKSL